MPIAGTRVSRRRFTQGESLALWLLLIILVLMHHSAHTRLCSFQQESESIAVNENCSKVLKRLIPILKSKDSLFAATSNDDRILEGSYVLTMLPGVPRLEDTLLERERKNRLQDAVAAVETTQPGDRAFLERILHVAQQKLQEFEGTEEAKVEESTQQE